MTWRMIVDLELGLDELEHPHIASVKIIKIQHQEPYQVSTMSLRRVFKRTCRFQMYPKINSCEIFIQIQHQIPCQDSTFPPSLFLESWRTWRFLMNLVVVSDDREHPLEASVKFSSRFNIRNPVKTPPVLHVSS